MGDKKNCFRTAVCVALVISILAVVIPIVIGTGYTYPCEDDFSFDLGGRMNSEDYGGILGALVGTYKFYVSWQGTYLASFLWFFIRPYDRAGLIGYHMVVGSIVSLFILAIYFLIKELVKDKLNVLMLSLIAYLIVFNTSSALLLKELFGWYTGCINYTLEFALSFLTLTLALRLKNETEEKRIKHLAIIGGIVGFLASGGSLEVTSFNCSWLLLFLILNYDWILKKKIILVPFGVSLLGALINACAIGNFVRYDVEHATSNYSIIDTLKDTLVCWQKEWSVIFQNRFLILLFIFLFVLCVVCKVTVFRKGIPTEKMLFLLPAIFLIQYFTAFPVVLGYQNSSLVFTRTTYTYQLLVKLTIMFLIVCFAQWVREHIKIPKFASIMVTLIVVVIIFRNSTILNDVKNGYLFNMSRELSNGTIKEVYELRKEVLMLLEQSEKHTDVHLRIRNVPESIIAYGMGLTEDADSQCNISAAGFYELKSLVVEYSEEYE